MSSPLIAVPASPASPANTVVTGGGWWPDVDCNQVRAELRLPEIVTHERLVAAIRGAMLGITAELATWRALREADGAASLAEVDGEDEIDGIGRRVLLFLRAVRFAAAAELAELHRDVTATDAGQARGDVQLLTAADYRRMVVHALREFLGTPRVAVELI